MIFQVTDQQRSKACPSTLRALGVLYLQPPCLMEARPSIPAWFYTSWNKQHPMEGRQERACCVPKPLFWFMKESPASQPFPGLLVLLSVVKSSKIWDAGLSAACMGAARPSAWPFPFRMVWGVPEQAGLSISSVQLPALLPIDSECNENLNEIPA